MKACDPATCCPKSVLQGAVLQEKKCRKARTLPSEELLRGCLLRRSQGLRAGLLCARLPANELVRALLKLIPDPRSEQAPLR